ncbi:hypothetical protein [Ornithinimicrobium flavum]|uniref:hypothetical protein n=1 Tax=Ornithinimicrobium flavum TaxID=1288636 RepID=UPI0010704289|nr:hypothetical protein [Ornithinimicrobium flavum]
MSTTRPRRPGADEPCAASESGVAGSGRARRRHRRVVAPPTSPVADESDDLPAGAAPDRPAERASRRPEDREDPHDAWIRAQRPPHWD